MNELRHYGVLGMKWGKRKGRTTHEDYARAHSKKKVSEMSNEELKNRNNRLQAEQQYKNLTKRTNYAKKIASAFIATSVTIAAVDRASKVYAKYGNAALDKIGDMVVKGIKVGGKLTT